MTLEIDTRFAPLVVGAYRLTVRRGVTDVDDNPLNSRTGPDGGRDRVIEFNLVFTLDETGDLYRVSLEHGERLSASTSTPFGSPLPAGSPGTMNDLDPRLILLDPHGNPVAFDNDSLDGRNALIHFTALEDGVYTVQVLAASGTGEYQLQTTVTPPSASGPRVTDVLVRSSEWTRDFLAQVAAEGLGDGGVSVFNTGGSGLTALPWTNLDQIVIRFDEEVVVGPENLTLLGVNVPVYPLDDHVFTSGFVASGAFEVVWSVDWSSLRDEAVGLETDRFLASLDGEVSNTVGVPLDGESRFRFGVLVGDVNGDGVVNILDPVGVRNREGGLAGDADSLYRATHDLDGDGVIDASDTEAARVRLFTALPAGEPRPPEAEMVSTMRSLHRTRFGRATFEMRVAEVESTQMRMVRTWLLGQDVEDDAEIDMLLSPAAGSAQD